MTSTTETQPIGEVHGEQAFRLDGFVERARVAAHAFRGVENYIATVFLTRAGRDPDVGAECRAPCLLA